MIDSVWSTPLTKRRAYGLRPYALEWLRAFTPLEPRLCGPLAEDELQPDRFVACIELDVAGDELAVVDLLDRLGHRAHRRDHATPKQPAWTRSPRATSPSSSRMRSWLPYDASLVD
ncbi:hypothetical protein [Polyangium sp. y55x31]|uniref:hypothetical protein n=1 Tax=Polyangium sp. y55x31 TaxID=3042688 RepID=UPI00248255BF|nr:hypothetical protein [Polyangium sp. y55x31]MDI1483570.1 hypothetical protein [Polyangium sp. y55x31]